MKIGNQDNIISHLEKENEELKKEIKKLKLIIKKLKRYDKPHKVFIPSKDCNGKTKWDHAHHSNCVNSKSSCITANTCKSVPYNVLFVPFNNALQILDKEVQRGKITYFKIDSQANRVYSIHGKGVTLCGDAGGGAAKMGQYLFGCITPDRLNKKQNGQRFNDGAKFYTLTAQDRHGVLIEGYIRKLTPIECERLQTVPDNYTEGVSLTQRYKMLGNGWTVDVIAHIFKEMQKQAYKSKKNYTGGTW